MLTCFLRIALPSILTNLMSTVSVVTNGVFAGRMDDPVKLAVVGLSGVICNIMISSVLTGLNCAQETLTSQAFGAKNLYLCGVYLNRGFFILLAFFIPFALLPCMIGDRILLAIGQDALVSAQTLTQVRALMPSVIFYGIYDLYKRWMACMRITLMPMLVMVLGTLGHIAFCYFFVNVLDLGVVGLAYASSIKDFILMLTVMIYSYCSKSTNCALVMVNRDAFCDWGKYLSISLPATAMICSEWWAFEIFTVLAGIMGVTQLAAMTICVNAMALLF